MRTLIVEVRVETDSQKDKGLTIRLYRKVLLSDLWSEYHYLRAPPTVQSVRLKKEKFEPQSDYQALLKTLEQTCSQSTGSQCELQRNKAR